MTKMRIKKSDRYNVPSIEKAIELIGGTEKLARKIEASYQTVRNWKQGFAVPNPLNCVRIEKVTGGAVKREDILPNYPWNELR